MTDVVLHSPILWAQRKDTLLVTIAVEDLSINKLDITEDKLHFEGVGGGAKSYEADLEFYDLVDQTSVKTRKSSRDIFITIKKKTPGPFWPRMSKTKLPYVKVDFNKWKDEDESDDDDAMGGMGSNNLEQMMAQMGGGGGDFPGLDDLNEGSDDSDDEALPDLEDDTPDAKS